MRQALEFCDTVDNRQSDSRTCIGTHTPGPGQDLYSYWEPQRITELPDLAQGKEMQSANHRDKWERQHCAEPFMHESVGWEAFSEPGEC